MPAISTYPTLLDEIKQIIHYQAKGVCIYGARQQKAGRLVWSKRGEEIASISIFVDM